jgi:hypothetical protein
MNGKPTHKPIMHLAEKNIYRSTKMKLFSAYNMSTKAQMDQHNMWSTMGEAFFVRFYCINVVSFFKNLKSFALLCPFLLNPYSPLTFPPPLLRQAEVIKRQVYVSVSQKKTLSTK